MGEKLKEDTSQNNLFARWNAVLTTQSKNFRTKVKMFRSMSEQENVKFSSESFSAQLDPMYTWKAVSTTLSKSLSRNADCFLSNIWKLNAFFFKILLWTRRRQFWQPDQKNFRQKAETIRYRSEKKILEVFFSINLASLFFLWHVETSSDKLGGNGFPKSGKFSIKARKWRKDS